MNRMTREEAIMAVKEVTEMSLPLNDRHYESLQMAIKALEEPERKKGNEKCSNELPCGWCSLFDTQCFGRGGEQDG